MLSKVLTYCYLLVWVKNVEARKIKAAGVFSFLATAVAGAALFGGLFVSKLRLPVPLLVLATSYIVFPVFADKLAARILNSLAFQQECQRHTEYSKKQHIILTVVLVVCSTALLLGGVVVGTVWAICPR
ncbi:MAG TPA: hypothetical protein VFO93_06355 [Hymenobacter sp.]|uniref:hypothetical protein n=1 Tax=Hymenobacter sp. TaxID=1898978 RepID=UPI002D805620|nr:hypothetical protein [Hymenobacter sp.]HET9503142.1 hypothetical protein [Hymenobacter sp.]